MSIPTGLYARMMKLKGVDWDMIAIRAFEDHIQELESKR